MQYTAYWQTMQISTGNEYGNSLNRPTLQKQLQKDQIKSW